MKVERIKTYKYKYICEVCGYSITSPDGKNNYDERAIIDHELKHRHNKPFEVREKVAWHKQFTMSDHGKPYEYSELVEGIIIKFTKNNMALVELNDGTRENVGIWELKLSHDAPQR